MSDSLSKDREDGKTGESAPYYTSVIRSSNRFKSIWTKDGLHFLDLMNYMPAKMSLDILVQSYNVKQGNAKFPYRVLSETGFMSKVLADERGHVLDPLVLYNAFNKLS